MHWVYAPTPLTRANGIAVATFEIGFEIRPIR